MQFCLYNFGPLSDAQVELGDLTVICGKNNSGKTYFTYSLYSFLHQIKYKRIVDINSINEDYFERFILNGECTIDLKEILLSYDRNLKYILDKFKKVLPHFLALPSSVLTRKTRVDARIDEDDKMTFYKNSIFYEIQVTENCLFSLKKKHNDYFLVMKLDNRGSDLPEQSRLKQMFSDVFSLFLNQVLPDVFALTGERSGISIFGDNIADFSRKIEQKEFKVIQRRKSDQRTDYDDVQAIPFSLPVTKELDFFRDLKTLQRKKSFLSDKYPEILEFAEKLSGGKYDFDEQLGVKYLPDGVDKSLSLPECSSSVKSLVELNFYLKHCAEKYQILMIDEPELNLHPEKQRQMAQLLAKLVNAGLKVFITTHSDYIIREFNTLISLKQAKPYLKRIMQEEGYQEDELLDASHVKTYIAKQANDGISLQQGNVSQQEGMEVSTLDDVINKMNEIQDAILWGE